MVSGYVHYVKLIVLPNFSGADKQCPGGDSCAAGYLTAKLGAVLKIHSINSKPYSRDLRKVAIKGEGHGHSILVGLKTIDGIENKQSPYLNKYVRVSMKPLVLVYVWVKAVYTRSASRANRKRCIEF